MSASLFKVPTIVLASMLGFATPAYAADPIEYELNIERQSLSGALQEFAKQSGIQIVFFSDVTDGYDAPSLTGKFTAATAILKLLNGSPLTFRELNPKTIEVQTKAAAISSDHDSGQADGPARTGAGATRNSQQQSSSVSYGQRDLQAKAAAGTDVARDVVELEEITVTGTRLRTANTASPMTVITQEDIKKQGLNSVEDIIRSLPQNFSNVNAATVLDGSIHSVDARGQSAANLRGLGAQNTLILVNGRRRAGSSTFDGGIVNLNTIPAGSIERVEVITDGASAIYGSDAVAGVINIILKKDYEGGETRVRQELASNDGDTLSIDQLLGKSWSTGNITASGRYSKTDGVNERKAGFTTADFTRWGGSDHRSRTLGQPGLVRGRGALAAADAGTSGIAGRLSPGNFVPYDSGQYSRYLTSESKSASFDVNVEQGLGERVRAYAEVAWSENKLDSMRGPPTVTNVRVPTSNRFNDLGAPVLVSYAFGNELARGLIPKNQYTSDQKALGATLGVRIELPIKDWKADVSATRSKEEAFFSGTGVNETLLAQRAAGLDAAGNPLPAAEHLNLFGNGTAQDPAAMQGLFVDNGFAPPSTSTSTLDSAVLSAEGALMSLPGGNVRLAVGGELRNEELDYSSDPSRSTFVYLIPKPDRDVKAAFAEAVIPLVGERNRLPGMYALDLFAAARWEEYAIAGPFDGPASPEVEATFEQTSPKFGLAWFVRPDLKLRATWSNSFRAPQLRNLFGVELGPLDFLPLIDPENPGDGLIFPDLYFTGNPELGPETSDNFTTGVDWTPAGVLPGLSVSLTYDKIRFTDRIADITNIAFTQPDLLFALPGVIERGPDGRIARVNLMPVNIATRESESVDLTTTYGFASRAGEITLGFSGTYAVKLEDAFIRGEPPEVLDGTQNGPEKHKYRGWVSWSRGHYGASLHANYSGHYTNTLGVLSPIGLQRVDSYATYDLTAYYRFDRLGWSINGGVRNLTNTEFPFFNGTNRPWDQRRVDTRGRTIYLEIVKKYGLPGSR